MQNENWCGSRQSDLEYVGVVRLGRSEDRVQFKLVARSECGSDPLVNTDLKP